MLECDKYGEVKNAIYHLNCFQLLGSLASWIITLRIISASPSQITKIPGRLPEATDHHYFLVFSFLFISLILPVLVCSACFLPYSEAGTYKQAETAGYSGSSQENVSFFPI